MYKNGLAVGETSPVKRDEPAPDLTDVAKLPQEVSSRDNLPPFKERLARPCAKPRCSIVHYPLSINALKLQVCPVQF